MLSIYFPIPNYPAIFTATKQWFYLFLLPNQNAVVENKEVQTSVHEVPRDAKDDSKDSNANRDVLLVPTIEEVIHFENL